MKGLICYDSKYGSTELVCQSIKRGMGIATDIKNVKDVKDFNYNIIVIGSPIFIGKPMQSITDFIISNREYLNGKNIALFVTCWAAATRYVAASDEFIEMIKKDLPQCFLLCSKALPGKLLMDEITERDKKALGRIIRRISGMSDEFGCEDTAWRDARDTEYTEDFGKEIINRFFNFRKI